MKGFIFATITIGAFAAANASDDENGKLDLSKINPDQLGAILQADDEAWGQFAPISGLLKHSTEEMTREELANVAGLFEKLGFIRPEEKDQFMMDLLHPKMRHMLKDLSSHFPETAMKLMRDPTYLQFLSKFQGRFGGDLNSADLTSAIQSMEGAEEDMDSMPTVAGGDDEETSD